MFNDEYYDEEANDDEVRPDYTLEDALKALPIDEEELVPPQVVMGFSDLMPEDLEQVRPVWKMLTGAQRATIMERLAEASEADYALDYSELATLGYDDPDPGVRLASIQAGWADESLVTMKRLMNLAQNDPASDVRAAAIGQLGQFIYLGEVEELSKDHTTPVEELALKLFRSTQETPDVQRRALEAISHCSRPIVKDLITEAYNHDDSLMRVSALNAMGNTCDPIWTEYVLNELESTDNEMLFEAVRAAGEIGIKEALPALEQLAYEEDRQIQEAAIWSLGEIGGEEAIEILSQLEIAAAENEDEALAEAIEEALGMASMVSDMMDVFDILSVYEEGEEFDDDAYEDEDEE